MSKLLIVMSSEAGDTTCKVLTLRSGKSVHPKTLRIFMSGDVYAHYAHCVSSPLFSSVRYEFV